MVKTVMALTVTGIVGWIGANAARQIDRQAARQIVRQLRRLWRELWPILYMLLPWITIGVLLFYVRRDGTLIAAMVTALIAGFVAVSMGKTRLHLIHLAMIVALALLFIHLCGPLGGVITVATPCVRTVWARIR